MCVFAIIVIGPAVKFPYSLMYENTSSNVLFITEPDSLCTLPTLQHASHIVQGQQREFLCDVFLNYPIVKPNAKNNKLV